MYNKNNIGQRSKNFDTLTALPVTLGYSLNAKDQSLYLWNEDQVSG